MYYVQVSLSDKVTSVRTHFACGVECLEGSPQLATYYLCHPCRSIDGQGRIPGTDTGEERSHHFHSITAVDEVKRELLLVSMHTSCRRLDCCIWRSGGFNLLKRPSQLFERLVRFTTQLLYCVHARACVHALHHCISCASVPPFPELIQGVLHCLCSFCSSLFSYCIVTSFLLLLPTSCTSDVRAYTHEHACTHLQMCTHAKQKDPHLPFVTGQAPPAFRARLRSIWHSA